MTPRQIEYLDRPPVGWFALEVMQKEMGSPIWVALMIDCHPEDYRAVQYRVAAWGWVRIAGNHRSREAAWDALEDMMSTRH
jgi:hypothetical protein